MPRFNPFRQRQLPVFMLTCLFSLCTRITTAQSIGIGTTTPNASAKVDIQATDKGMLIPRMTSVQRTSIPSPAPGLMVYDTNTKSFWYWDAAWLNMSTLNNVWSLSGNAGTNVSTNFIGTTDNTSLLFKVNNIRAGYIGVDPGDGNVALGYQAANSNVSGNSNVAIGTRALFNNTTSNNIGIGDSSLLHSTTGFDNTAIGSKSLYSNTIGHHNTAEGYQSLLFNTSGADNVAVGSSSLRSNTTGSFNTATGISSLSTNTVGESNSSYGILSLSQNTSGNNNSGFGNNALLSNTTASANTAIGVAALQASTTGGANTAVGNATLNSNLTGSNNTGLGSDADVASGDLSNATAIGSNARVDCSNCMVLGSVNGINGATADVNVGIGTSNPNSKLQVNGKTQTSQLQVGNGSILSNIQSGTLTVGNSVPNSVTVTLTFPIAFASPPKVIATVRNENGTSYADTFAFTLRSVTNTQAVFNIQRVDMNVGWAQNLQLDWIALQ